MTPGIFSTVFARPNLDAVLDAMVAAGFQATQFHLGSALAVDDPRQNTIPAELDDDSCRWIRAAFQSRGVSIPGVSGTFNITHPDPARRDEGFRRLELLASHCGALETDVITLCSGTLDADYMWAAHPDNGSKQAWDAMLDGMARAAQIAERHCVRVAFEPEVSNVIDSAKKARAAIDSVGSPNLKVCIDGANLYHKGDLARMHDVLTEAFQLVGDDIVLAHAKDVSRDGEAGHDAAGTGLLDYEAYLRHLRQVGYDGAVVLHSLAEAQVPGCRAFLLGKLEAAAMPPE
jgi:sugar phosphate isomerase/epimerase